MAHSTISILMVNGRTALGHIFVSLIAGLFDFIIADYFDRRRFIHRLYGFDRMCCLVHQK